MTARSQRSRRDNIGCDSRGEPAFVRSAVIRTTGVPITRQLYASRQLNSFPNTSVAPRFEHQFVRATVATERDTANRVVTVPAQRERYGLSLGPDRTMALIEATRTNFLLNSTAPSTQTTASLGTGVYVLWMEGTGSVTSSAGTATITGAGAATAGAPNVFTVTVAGTVTVTVAGSPTRFQLETGGASNAFPTSFIATAGSTVQRNSDSLRWVPNAAPGGSGLFGSAGTIVLMCRLPVVNLNGTNQTIAQIDSNVDTNRFSIAQLSGSTQIAARVIVGGSTLATLNGGVVAVANTIYKMVFAWDAGIQRFAVTGGTLQSAAVANPTGLTTLRYGNAVAGNEGNSALVGVVARYTRRLPDSQLLDLTRNP